jgi:hypothetical protein
LVPGTTLISPKTNGGVLYDNNGTLGDSTTLPSGLTIPGFTLSGAITGAGNPINNVSGVYATSGVPYMGSGSCNGCGPYVAEQGGPGYFYHETDQNPYESGTAQAGSSNTLTLATRSCTISGGTYAMGCEANDYVASVVTITSGTGNGQSKTISAITPGTSPVITISGTFSPAPDSTSHYALGRIDYGWWRTIADGNTLFFEDWEACTPLTATFPANAFDCQDEFMRFMRQPTNVPLAANHIVGFNYPIGGNGNRDFAIGANWADAHTPQTPRNLNIQALNAASNAMVTALQVVPNNANPQLVVPGVAGFCLGGVCTGTNNLSGLTNNYLVGNVSGSTGPAIGLTPAQAKTALAIANTDVSGLGTMSTQNANAVAITGGNSTGLTTLSVNQSVAGNFTGPINFSPTLTGTSGSQAAMHVAPTFTGVTGDSSPYFAFAFTPTINVSGTQSESRGIWSETPTVSGGAVTTNYAFYANSTTATTNNYSYYSAAGLIKQNDATQSTSASTGSIITAGGIGAAGNIFSGGALTAVGNFVTATGSPTIASGACGTGTNGTIAGDNQSGVITIGAVATTSCAVSFSKTLANAPKSCVAFPGNAAAAAGTVLAYIGTIATTGFTLSGSVLASTKFNYHCY